MALTRALAGALVLAAGASAASEPVRSSGPNWSAEIAFAPEVADEPVLDARLRAEADAALAEFLGWAAADPQASHPYELAISDAVAFRADRWLSVARTTYAYTGGAHGNTSVSTVLWDRAAGAEAGIGALLADAAPGAPGLVALSEALRDGIAAEVYGGTVDDFWAADVIAATAPEAARLSTFALVPSTEAGRAAALDFRFSPYEIAAYALGAPTVRVSWRVIEPFLSDDGRALFGGEPRLD
jgi:hypothetical protein